VLIKIIERLIEMIEPISPPNKLQWWFKRL